MVMAYLKFSSNQIWYCFKPCPLPYGILLFVRYGRFRPSGWKSERERRVGVSAMGSAATAALMLRRAESAGSAMSPGGGAGALQRKAGEGTKPPSPLRPLQMSWSTPADLDAAFMPSSVESPVDPSPTSLPPPAGLGLYKAGEGEEGGETILANGSASSLTVGPHPGLVTWQDVWQYAGRSVLYDIRMRRRATNAPR